MRGRPSMHGVSAIVMVWGGGGTSGSILTRGTGQCTCSFKSKDLPSCSLRRLQAEEGGHKEEKGPGQDPRQERRKDQAILQAWLTRQAFQQASKPGLGWSTASYVLLRAEGTSLLVGSRAVSIARAPDGHCAFCWIVVGTISKQLSRAKQWHL